LRKAEYQKAYYEANREKVKASNKAYYKANPEKSSAISKAYYGVNVEKIKIKNKAYLEANPQANALRVMAVKSKTSRREIRALVPQELIEVKLLQLQLHRMIHARA
jgi:hypothetical protein